MTQQKKIIFFISAVIVFCIMEANAKAEDFIPQGLESSLTKLKLNIDVLSVSNRELQLKNDQIKSGLNQNQMALQKAIQENQRLEEEKNKLSNLPSAQAAQFDRLNKTIAELDQQIADLTGQVKASQDKIAAQQKQEEQLNLQITQFGKSKDMFSEEMSFKLAQILDQKQKQKMAILKLISESQNRQLLVQEKILDSKKSIPNIKKASDSNFGKKAILEAKIQQGQDEIMRLKALEKSDSKRAWSEEELHELTMHVDNLEKNRNELKGLLEKMQNKLNQNNQNASIKEQAGQRLKIQSSISQLKTDTRNLKIDLAGLQQQMIVLDKRKSYMEALLQK